METSNDITERDRLVEAVHRNELLVQALLQLNGMTELPKQAITDFVLAKSVELTKSKIGYLGFLNEDETILTMHWWPDGGWEERTIPNGPSRCDLAEPAPWEEALRQRRPTIVNDQGASNRSEQWRAMGQGHFGAHVDVPVFEGEDLVLVAGVANGETNYNEFDVQQLMLLIVSMWRLLQRKQAEERLLQTADALRRSEAYLAEAQRLTHTGSWADDGNGQPLYWSEELYRIFGIDPRQGLPTPDQPLERIHPADRGMFLRAFDTARRAKVDSELEFRIVLPDGKIRHVHGIGHPDLNANGDVVEFVGTAVDITERKRAEETLRRSEAYLAEAERLTHTGSFAGDATTQPLYWSEELYRMFGFDPQQGLPTREQPLERIHPDDRDKVLQAFDRVIHQKVDSEVDYRIVLTDGTVKYAHGIGHPILNVNGDLIEFVGTIVDITERKRAEEERARLHHLETDLAHINRVSIMGELTASIAHEVNQPLSGVVSNASACLRWLAGDAPNLEEAREAARRIVRDGKRAAEIIARIRALTKRAAAQREKLDVNVIIREVLPLFGDEAKKKGVIIRTCFAEEVHPILGDRVQLQQVVLNLVINGIEAMSSVLGRSRELLIATRNTEQEQVEIRIEDSGIGLEPDQSARIFDAFYTTKLTGMGMGLSICRTIVQAHGGQLSATVNDGPGTTFHFTLPREREESNGELEGA